MYLDCRSRATSKNKKRLLSISKGVSLKIGSANIFGDEIPVIDMVGLMQLEKRSERGSSIEGRKGPSHRSLPKKNGGSDKGSRGCITRNILDEGTKVEVGIHSERGTLMPQIGSCGRWTGM